MGRISLEGMTFFSRHGFYEEENVIGSEFIVDVYAETDLDSAAMSDNIRLATNYEDIYLITRWEMEADEPVKLLEKLCFSIAKKVKAKVGGIIQSVNVIIRKCNPPLGGRVKYSVVETSGRIGLEGVAFFGMIGSTEEEMILANEFVANVYATVDFQKASVTDDLKDTLNYESIFWAIKTEVEEPAELLENVAYRIADNLKKKHNNIKSIEVELKRKHPSVRGKLPAASVEMEFDHEAECAKCGKGTMCYLDENCWCNEYQIFPATQAMIDLKYGGCICKDCTEMYGRKK